MRNKVSTSPDCGVSWLSLTRLHSRPFRRGSKICFLFLQTKTSIIRNVNIAKDALPLESSDPGEERLSSVEEPPIQYNYG